MVRLAEAVAQPPRDRKTWGALAYLLLTERPPSRRRLAELLFPDVDDPLASVRWVLTSVRRLLGGGVVVEGDPVALRRPAAMFVDVDVVERGRWSEAASLSNVDRELLEGVSFDAAPAFDLWLTGERRRLGGLAAAVLREAALASLARDPAQAAAYAERLVGLDAYDENHHVVLVRSLVAAGRSEEAARRVEACVALFESELGTTPSGALRDALATRRREPEGVATRASVRARLDAAQAAVAAGSWTDGIDLFRRAVAESERLDDPPLRARALVGLGSALVHAARGHDEEGAASLHEAGELAEQIGALPLAATAWRELAWVEFLRARYERAWLWLERAGGAAGDDPSERAWIMLVSGAARTDTGDHDGAFRDLAEAIDVADRDGLVAPAAFARSFLGRLHLLRDELESAASVLARSIEQARDAAWTSLLPWPESLLAEVELRRGDLGSARELFEHAFTIGRELGDPCWESMGARGLGLVTVSEGDLDGGLRLLEDAPRLCRRLPDAYLWIEAYGLDALCSVAVEHGLPSAPRWIAELEQLAGRAGFRELIARALLYRSRLGDDGAPAAARAAADAVAGAGPVDLQHAR
ncbi:MAG TPA: BTAD domain-containing putative transcriptional regulator [Gaiellaceae bacterium]|nr:BTAD domain-containing putative transcriptional regulator [Gaiellaceae bacterium]